jgi:DNA-binding response OmpR family regulator
MQKRYKVFITEDEENLQEIYTTRFQLNNFEVKSFRTGFELVTALSDEVPDVILLDIMMPEMNGFETLETINKNFSSEEIKKLPILIWSNLSNRTDEITARNLGAKLYLRKSDYSGQDLVDEVRKFLDKESDKF